MTTLLPTYRRILFLLAMLNLLGLTRSAFAGSGEYQVKAAMIYNLTRFMDWPEDSLSPGTSQINICVVGKGSLGAAVDGLRGKQVKGRDVAVRQIGAADSTASCQVLVLSGVNNATTSEILGRSRSGAVLTVADSASFASNGGVVGFVLQEGKVKFELNPAAAKRHRISISAQLLKLSQIVRENP